MNIANKYKEVHLFFDEEQHKYTDNFNNNYISTTTILHHYQNLHEHIVFVLHSNYLQFVAIH